MTPGKIENLGHLRLGDLISIDPAQPDPLLVDVKHDPCRLLSGAVEEPFQNEHDKFHWRVIIIQKKDAVERRLFCTNPGFSRQAETCAITVPCLPAPGTARVR